MSTPSATEPEAFNCLAPNSLLKDSLDTQAVLHLFERVSLRLGVEEKHDEELHHHHRSEKHEGISAGRRCELRECICNDRVHDPVRRASDALPLRAHAARKHLAYVHPNHGALRNREEINVNDEEHEKITLVAVRKEHPGNAQKASSRSDGSNQQKSFAAQLVDHRHAQQCRRQIHPADRHGLQIAGHLAVTGCRKNVIQIIKNGINTRKLVEHTDGNRKKKREAVLPGKKRLGRLQALDVYRSDDLTQLAFRIFGAHRLQNGTRLVDALLRHQPPRAWRDAEEKHEKKQSWDCGNAKLPPPLGRPKSEPPNTVVGQISEQNSDDDIYLESPDQATARLCGRQLRDVNRP